MPQEICDMNHFILQVLFPNHFHYSVASIYLRVRFSSTDRLWCTGCTYMARGFAHFTTDTTFWLSHIALTVEGIVY